MNIMNSWNCALMQLKILHQLQQFTANYRAIHIIAQTIIISRGRLQNGINNFLSACWLKNLQTGCQWLFSNIESINIVEIANIFLKKLIYCQFIFSSFSFALVFILLMQSFFNICKA